MNKKDINLFFNELSYERLDNCLTETEIDSFEKNNNVKIPEQYRCFLLYIGNGIRLCNGKVIQGLKKPVEKLYLKRLSHRFLFKDGINYYLKIEPKPYPRYDDKFPQYEDCLDPINLENGCNKCKHYMECIDSLYDDNPLYDPMDNAFFNGCFDLHDTRLLIFTGDSKGQVWRASEGDSGVLYPEFKDFFKYVKYLASIDK